METFTKHITEDDNDIIQIAAYIADKGIEGAMHNDLVTFLYQRNKITENEKDELIKAGKFFNSSYNLDKDIAEKFRKLLSLLDTGSSFDRDENKISITYEGVTSLLDFIELKYARQNSKDAKTNSQIAIGLSIFALLVSTVIGLLQISGSVEIDNNQFNKIINEKYSDKLDRINNELIISNQKVNSLIIKIDSLEKRTKLNNK